VLGRLLWGLSYQRVPGTLVLIDRPNIDPSPFSAAPADPIALVPSHLTSLPERAARGLRTRLPLTRPEGTVRWFTPGLDHALAECAAGSFRRRPWEDRCGHRRIARTGGIVVFAARPRVLREWAVDVCRLGNWIQRGMDYTYLYADEETWWAHGEVQVFTDYRHRVSAARAARREILGELPGQPLPDAVDPDIWERADVIRRNTRLSSWGRRPWRQGRLLSTLLPVPPTHPRQMPLDLVDRMMGEILVHLRDDARLHIGVEGLAQVGERARRRSDNGGLHVALAHQLFERVGDLASEAVLLDLVPVGRFDGAALVLRSRPRGQPARTLGALVAGQRVVVDEHLFGGQIGKFLVAGVAQKQRLAAVADEHDRVMRNADLGAHGSSCDTNAARLPQQWKKRERTLMFRNGGEENPVP
jgi:hypothetical protein